MMSRKDYIAISDVLRFHDGNVPSVDERRLVAYIARDIAIYLQQDDERFDKDRFLEACQKEQTHQE